MGSLQEKSGVTRACGCCRGISNRARAVEWHNSNEYAELIKLRQAGANATLTVIEGVE